MTSSVKSSEWANQILSDDTSEILIMLQCSAVYNTVCGDKFKLRCAGD
uniref:Uncharacterized protein n=1 Tax=Medicago truncatula TaxID=3880 RepID=A2Q4H4_MEDTR|nr:hypothetical protein MtrDRAFT_AC157488g7v2 [Medicago truncatula]